LARLTPQHTGIKEISMGKPFESEGRYRVQITEAFIKPDVDRDDPSAFALVVKGETEDGYEGWYNFNYKDKKISGGKHEGKSVGEVTKENLAALGVKDGYAGNIDKAIADGLFAMFVVQYDNYFTPPRLMVKYVNPESTLIPIAEVDIDAMLRRFETKEGVDVKPAKPEPPAFNNSPIDDDDIPF
jgi:hypothetical protein